MITKNTANTVVLTLKEKQTLTNPYWIFRIWNDLEHGYKIFRAADTSDYTDRYNKFTITDSTTEDLANGTVDFDAAGFWHYEVWESQVTTLSVTTAATMVESGKIKVEGTSNFTFIEHTPDNTTWITHEPGA